jgi:membrane-bound ClpP family serine protease
LIGTSFDINIGAIFLILLGIGLLIIEIKVTGFGIFEIASLVSLIIGNILLVPTGSKNIYTPEFQGVLTLTVVVSTIRIISGFCNLQSNRDQKEKTDHWRVYRGYCANYRPYGT